MSKSEAKRLKVQRKPPALRGRVTSIHGEEGFGFILGINDTEYFFHHSMVEGSFDSLKAGDTVEFSPLISAKGPRAVGVKKVA